MRADVSARKISESCVESGREGARLEAMTVYFHGNTYTCMHSCTHVHTYTHVHTQRHTHCPHCASPTHSSVHLATIYCGRRELADGTDVVLEVPHIQASLPGPPPNTHQRSPHRLPDSRAQAEPGCDQRF